jgi:hypothetical protein
MPDILAVDFIKSVMKVFLCVPIIDGVAKKIRIEKFEALATDFANAQDLSGLLDISEPIELRYDIGYAQSNEIEWASDRTLADDKVNNGSLFCPAPYLPDTKRLMQFLFASSESVAISNGNLLVQNIPIRTEKNIKPRIGYLQAYTGTRPTINVGSASNVQYQAMRYINASDAQDFSFNSLKANYWQQLAKQIEAPERLTATFIIRPSDMFNLDIGKMVYLNVKHDNVLAEGYYFIKAVNEFQAGKKTEIELTRVNPY